jgi:putative Mg2+ transporter-C (MgtC) family protein
VAAAAHLIEGNAMPTQMPWLMPSLNIIAHMGLAMLLGWVVGYERFYSGRAAGSQVYCFVCVTAAAVTLVAGYPGLWYGGTGAGSALGDPSGVMGSILSSIGFLGAGLIVQSGMNVRGLTTAASIWGVAALGILVGVGLYLPAIALTALFITAVELLPRLERRLPARTAFSSTIRFREGYQPRVDGVRDYLSARGLSLPAETMTLKFGQRCFQMDCLIFESGTARSSSMSSIAL